MADMAQVVQLGSLFNQGLTQRSAINRGICPYFNVIFYNELSTLRKLQDGVAITDITETVGTDHDPGVQNHPVSDLSAPIDYDIGMNHALRSHQAPSGNITSRANYGRTPDPDTVFDDDVRPNFHPIGKFGTGTDDGRRMYTWNRVGGREQPLCCLHEGELGIGNHDRGFGGKLTFRNQNTGRLTGGILTLQARFSVTEVPRTRGVDVGNVLDRLLGRTPSTAHIGIRPVLRLFVS